MLAGTRDALADKIEAQSNLQSQQFLARQHQEMVQHQQTNFLSMFGIYQNAKTHVAMASVQAATALARSGDMSFEDAFQRVNRVAEQAGAVPQPPQPPPPLPPLDPFPARPAPARQPEARQPPAPRDDAEPDSP
jgi:hypothetical protein